MASCSISDLLAEACENKFSCVAPGGSEATGAVLQFLCNLNSIQGDILAGQSPPFSLQVQRGLIPGVRRQVIFGHNDDIDSATVPEDIWRVGGLYPFQTSAQSLEILSDNANDTAAGTGARTVRVRGLDSGWLEQSEVVSLNGTTPVALTLSYLRVNGAECVTAGSSATNAGAITVRVAGGGAIQARIAPADGLAMQAVFSVPDDKKAFFISRESCLIRSGASGAIEINVMIRQPEAQQPWIARNTFGVQSDGTSSLVKTLPFLVVPGRTDFRATVVNSTANDANIVISFETILIDN